MSAFKAIWVSIEWPFGRCSRPRIASFNRSMPQSQSAIDDELDPGEVAVFEVGVGTWPSSHVETEFFKMPVRAQPNQGAGHPFQRTVGVGKSLDVQTS